MSSVQDNSFETQLEEESWHVDVIESVRSLENDHGEDENGGYNVLVIVSVTMVAIIIVVVIVLIRKCCGEF